MHERLLYRVLTAGVSLLKTDNAMMEDLFLREEGLDPAEVEAIKTFWADQTPTVHHSYPRRDFTPPFYSIVLGNENESGHFIGEDAGMISDPEDPNYGQEELASEWKHTYQIFCVTEHPDATIYTYQAAKYIFASAHDLLAGEGFYEMHLGGMDLAPDPRFMPEHWFVRQLSLEFKAEFARLDKTSALGKAWKVGGIHIDRAGAPGEDTGDVKTLVYPVNVAEE